MQIIRCENPQVSVENDKVGFLPLWEKEKENPFKSVFLLKNEDAILGYLMYAKMYERIEIEQFEVQEEERGKGYGRKLLESLFKYALENGVENITLEVKQDNQTAISLYHKFGFRNVAVRTKYYHGTDGILMECTLPKKRAL